MINHCADCDEHFKISKPETEEFDVDVHPEYVEFCPFCGGNLSYYDTLHETPNESDDLDL